MPSRHLQIRIVTRLAFTLAIFTLVITSGIFYATNVSAAPGDVDPTFTASVGTNSSVFAVAIQSDGKVIIGGLFTQVNGVTRNRIARLNADGSLDTMFDPGTSTNSSVLALAVQPTDGKVVVGGNFSTVNGVTRNRIARLNTDGTLDTTFDPGTGANGNVNAVAVQPADGGVIIGGFFTMVNNVSRLGIARLQGANNILIEGYIRRASGAPIGGVRVTLSGSVQAVTTTDIDGHYRFSVPTGGVYQVTAAARGIRFSPSTLTFGSSTVNQVGDFTALTIKGRRDVRALR